LDSGTTLFDPNAPDGDVFALIHPHAVSIHATMPHGSPRNVWHGRVDGLDVARDVARIAVSSKPPIVAEITVAALTELRLTLGTEIWVSMKATEISTYPV
jgi:molybdate transport system ATP-binding protein